MGKKLIYPSKYELEEVLSRIVDNNFLRNFSKERGMFFFNIPQKELSKELTHLYYDDKDLEEIRRKAYNKVNNHTLSGFVIESKDENFSMVDLYDNIRKGAKFPKGFILNSLSKQKDKDVYVGSIEYNRIRPGRIEFLQDETSFFSFYIIKNEANWQIEVDCSKSTDSKEFFDIVKRNLRNDIEDTLVLDEDLLTTENSIVFFDELALKGLPNEWVLMDIKSITIRRGKDDIDDVDDVDDNEDNREDNSEDGEVSDEHLTGIRQAILEGKNLRSNRFVQESQRSGYRFTSMIYEFKNKKTPNYIKLKAEFKGRPKVFEVAITGYDAEYGSGADALVRQPDELKEVDNYNLRSIFWNNAKAIFSDLKKK